MVVFVLRFLRIVIQRAACEHHVTRHLAFIGTHALYCEKSLLFPRTCVRAEYKARRKRDASATQAREENRVARLIHYIVNSLASRDSYLITAAGETEAERENERKGERDGNLVIVH